MEIEVSDARGQDFDRAAELDTRMAKLLQDWGAQIWPGQSP